MRIAIIQNHVIHVETLSCDCLTTTLAARLTSEPRCFVRRIIAVPFAGVSQIFRRLSERFYRA